MSALAGKRIVVTRPRAQAEVLLSRLREKGAIPIAFPTIEIAPLLDYGVLDAAIAAVAQYDWIVFTSVNGVETFWKRVHLTGLKDLSGVVNRIATIGPATAKAVEAHGARVTFMPQTYIAEAIVEGLGEVQGQRFLLPRAELAREALAVELKRRGAVVDEIAAYRTRPAAPDPSALAELKQGVSAITFTSSSTVRNFVALDAKHYLTNQTVIACLGPITSQTAREVGLPVTLTAAEYTLDGLLTALETYYAQP